MCILLYVKLIWCSGIPYIYPQLEEGVGSVCHSYMCILLYMRLMWCSGVAEIYGQLEEGGVSLPWVDVHSATCETLQCSGFPEICARLEEGVR